MKKIYVTITGFFVLMSLSTAISAQNVYIPDPVFKSALVGNSSININTDAEIQETEAVAYNGFINVNGIGIFDLTGIEAFTNLTGLACGYLCTGNYLTSLDLSSNTALTFLDCSSNFLSTLDLSANTALTNIDCSSNYLTSLDLSANTAITDLYCSNNQLTNLNLPASSELDNLFCSYNQLTNLDVSSNPNLVYLYCYNNQLTCLDLSANIFLTNFDCSYNQLTGLNVQNGNNPAITFFYAANNPNMYCVQVDDVAYSNGALGTSIFTDPFASFSTNCSAPIASFTTISPVCFGTPVIFQDQSFGASFWYWYFDDGNSSTAQSPQHTYDTLGNFDVKLVASNCYGSDTTYNTIVQGVDIYGHASYSGGPVTAGVAIIYPFESYYTSFDTTQIQPIDGFGDYLFTNIPQGDYLVQIFPDTLAFPTLIPTYSSNQWAWDSAVVILHGCVYADTAHVVMTELTPSSPGIGLLHGTIIEGQGFGRAPGEPVHGVVIKLGVTGSSSILASTISDTITGEYTFANVDFGTYTVYVDIPGLERDSSYTITVDAANNQFINLNYLVDSVAIYILLNIGIEDNSATGNNQLNVYPNPSKENTTIHYTINSDAKVQLDIYNVYGVKVQSLVNAHQLNGEYYCNFTPKSIALKSGVYFISLSANGKTKTMRIVVME